MDFYLVESELKKRIKLPYYWGRKQQNKFDRQTNFIYKIDSFELILKEIENRFGDMQGYDDLKDYTLNRWYNFWSAQAVETIFCNHKNVEPHSNSRDKFIDFYINEIPFDHKTTVFPKGFKKSIPFAMEHKSELIEWLYQNQSSEQRKHSKNRLFIVLGNYESNNEHWKLKAELSWLKDVISGYLLNFDSSKLHSFTSENGIVKADIIWAIK